MTSSAMKTKATGHSGIKNRKEHMNNGLLIVGEKMPTNCAHCFCLVTDHNGRHCGTTAGDGKRICDDSLYFDQMRPKWCPLEEVKDE